LVRDLARSHERVLRLDCYVAAGSDCNAHVCCAQGWGIVDAIACHGNYAFDSIIEAIRLGRLVFQNLQKVIAYLLPAGSWSEDDDHEEGAERRRTAEEHVHENGPDLGPTTCWE
jgi:hypothetical protein